MAFTDSTGFTPEKEEFVNQLMQGVDIQKAYRAATGFPLEKTSYNAYRWVNDDHYVKNRLKELRQHIQMSTQVTLDNHLSKLAELRDEAQAAGKFGPAIAAEVARGKAAGLYVEKKQITVNSPNEMSKEAILKRLADIDSHKTKLLELTKVGPADFDLLSEEEPARIEK